MKLVRVVDSQGAEQNGVLHADQSVTRLEGDVFGDCRDSGQVLNVVKWLAPSARSTSFVSA